jgi:glycosyltransferase involved in cell wall biosynthesis
VLTGIFPNRRNDTWGIHVFQNVRALSEHADVRVVAPVPWVPRVLARGRYRAYLGVPRADEWQGIAVTYPRFFVVPKVGRFLHGFGMFLSVFVAVGREIGSFRPDTLLAYFAYPYGFAAVRFGSWFRIPVVVSCRGGDINHMTAPRLQGRLIARSLRSCARVLVMSDEMRARVVALGVDPARVDVVGNGVDGSRFAPADRADARAALGLPGDARILVCVSRLSPEKGIDVLVDAMAQIHDPSLRLYVVGDGVAKDALIARARERGQDGRITFALTRPHAEIPLWLAAANVAVLPSRTEGMPNAVLEALASGRPVVATGVGGTRELVTDGVLGRLVEPGDAAALARGIREALASAWDEASIAASVASRTWDGVGRATARLVDFREGADPARPERTSPEHNPWTAGTR